MAAWMDCVLLVKRPPPFDLRLAVAVSPGAVAAVDVNPPLTRATPADAALVTVRQHDADHVQLVHVDVAARTAVYLAVSPAGRVYCLADAEPGNEGGAHADTLFRFCHAERPRTRTHYFYFENRSRWLGVNGVNLAVTRQDLDDYGQPHRYCRFRLGRPPPAAVGELLDPDAVQRQFGPTCLTRLGAHVPVGLDDGEAPPSLDAYLLIRRLPHADQRRYLAIDAAATPPRHPVCIRRDLEGSRMTIRQCGPDHVQLVKYADDDGAAAVLAVSPAGKVGYEPERDEERVGSPDTLFRLYYEVGTSLHVYFCNRSRWLGADAFDVVHTYASPAREHTQFRLGMVVNEELQRFDLATVLELFGPCLAPLDGDDHGHDGPNLSRVLRFPPPQPDAPNDGRFVCFLLPARLGRAERQWALLLDPNRQAVFADREIDTADLVLVQHQQWVRILRDTPLGRRVVAVDANGAVVLRPEEARPDGEPSQDTLFELFYEPFDVDAGPDQAMSFFFRHRNRWLGVDATNQAGVSRGLNEPGKRFWIAHRTHGGGGHVRQYLFHRERLLDAFSFNIRPIDRDPLSLHLLYAPGAPPYGHYDPGALQPPHAVDVILFHGILSGSESSWTNDGGVLWPVDLLRAHLPGCRVWTFGYKSGIAWIGRRPVNQLDYAALVAEHFLPRFVAYGLGTTGAPVVLLGHSMGGLIIKQVCTVLPVRPAAVVFFGTPHHGADITETWARLVLHRPVRHMRAMQPNNPDLHQLTARFLATRTPYLNVVETQPPPGVATPVVARELAELTPSLQAAAGQEPLWGSDLLVAKHHLNIHRPHDGNDLVYQHLVRFLKHRLNGEDDHLEPMEGIDY